VCLCESVHLRNPSSLNAEGVLVYCEQGAVLQECLGRGRHGAQVARQEQGGGHQRPHAHLHPLLVVAQTIVTHDDLQHTHSTVDVYKR